MGQAHILLPLPKWYSDLVFKSSTLIALKIWYLGETDNGASEGLMPQRVRGVGNMQWHSGGMCKSTLQVYGEHKPTAAKERLYDNNIGSVLLFEARAGALCALAYCRGFDSARKFKPPSVVVAQKTTEPAEHIILDCACLSPCPTEGTTLMEVLGFSKEGVDLDAAAVSITKARLQMWWKYTVGN